MGLRKISDAALPPKLRAAYLRTVYRVGPTEIRIGKRGYRTDNLVHSMGVRSCVLFTAWNPMSRKMPEGWNRRMQRQLGQLTRHWHTAVGLGGDARWAEEHVLVAADPRLCLKLARRFRQRAVVELRRGQQPALVVLA